MVAMFCLVLAMFVVLTVVGTVARLMLSAVWALGLMAFLGWLAMSPAPALFPAVWWLLGAWVAVVSLRHLPRFWQA